MPSWCWHKKRQRVSIGVTSVVHENEEVYIAADAAVNSKLLKAAANGDVDEIKAIVAQVKELSVSRNCSYPRGFERHSVGVLLSGLSGKGRTALHAAVLNGHEKAAKVLVDAGAPLHIADKSGLTPVHIAASNNDTNCLHILLNKRAYPNTPVSFGCDKGKTPLMLAVENGAVDTACILIDSWRPNGNTKYNSDLIGTALINSAKKKKKKNSCNKSNSFASSLSSSSLSKLSEEEKLNKFIRDRLDAAEIIQNWWRKTYSVRCKTSSKAAITIQTWYRAMYTRRWFKNALQRYKEATSQVNEFKNLRSKCQSDENFLTIKNTFERYNVHVDASAPIEPPHKQLTEAIRKCKDMQEYAKYAPPQFYKKTLQDLMFIWSSPQANEGNIVGMIGAGDKIVVQAHVDRKTSPSDGGLWIQLANPIDPQTGLQLYGGGEAWCLKSFHAGIECDLFEHQEFVDYTAMGTNAWRNWGIEIANLSKKSQSGCVHYYAESVNPNQCMFCNQIRPLSNTTNSNSASSTDGIEVDVLTLKDMDLMIKPLPFRCDEELLVEALAGNAKRNMQLLCRDTKSSVILPCDRLLHHGYEQITTTMYPKCKNGHRLHISAHKYIGYNTGYMCDQCGGRSSQGHNGGSLERWCCEACQYDICFRCCNRSKSSATELKAPTLLQAAACSNNVDILEVFFDERYDECASAIFPTDLARSPIILAAASGSEEAAVFLINRFCRGTSNVYDTIAPSDMKIEYYKQDSVLSTATNIAVINGHWGLLQALREQNYDFQYAADDSTISTLISTLWPAACGGISLRIRSCQPRKTAMKATDSPFLDPFMSSIHKWVNHAKLRVDTSKNSSKIAFDIDRMLSLGFAIDAASSNNGVTALMLVARQNLPWLVTELLNRGASPSIVDNDGLSVWWHAADANAVDCLHVLATHRFGMFRNHFCSVVDGTGAGTLLAAPLGKDWIGTGTVDTPLATAMRHMYLDTTAYLLQLGCPLGNLDLWDGLVRPLVAHSKYGECIAGDVLLAEAKRALNTLRTTSQQPIRLASIKSSDPLFVAHLQAFNMLVQALKVTESHFEEGHCVRHEIEAMLIGTEIQRSLLVEMRQSCPQGETKLKKDMLMTHAIVVNLPWHLEEHARLYYTISRGLMTPKIMSLVVGNLNANVLQENWRQILQVTLSCENPTATCNLNTLSAFVPRLRYDDVDTARKMISETINTEQIVSMQFSKNSDERNRAIDFISKIFPSMVRQCDVCYCPIDDPTECCKQTGGEHYKKVACDHEYCKPCLVEWITNNIDEHNIQIRCPDDKCQFIFSGDDVNRVVPGKYSKFVEIGNANYKARINDVATDPAMKKYLAAHTRLCPNCNVIIERSAGCNSMRCPCGHSFQWNVAPYVTRSMS